MIQLRMELLWTGGDPAADPDRRNGRCYHYHCSSHGFRQEDSLMQRSLMQESISAPQVGGIVRFTGFFLKGIALIELLGAILLAPVFIKDFGVGKDLVWRFFIPFLLSATQALT